MYIRGYASKYGFLCVVKNSGHGYLSNTRSGCVYFNYKLWYIVVNNTIAKLVGPKLAVACTCPCRLQNVIYSH